MVSLKGVGDNAGCDRKIAKRVSQNQPWHVLASRIPEKDREGDEVPVWSVRNRTVSTAVGDPQTTSIGVKLAGKIG